MIRPASALLLLAALAAAGGGTGQGIPDFSGTWETTYGTLVLNQDGSSVSGFYLMGGMCTVEGSVEASGRLVFTYEEPSASGEGWFELAPDGASFSGQWRARGSSTWSGWEGYRSGSEGAGSKWLVILETEWQDRLDEQEYSFGDMLEAWFARLDGVSVRHRFVHDTDDLELFCAQAAMLPGEVFLVFSSHATEEGIALSEGTAGAREIIEAIEPCGNLAMIHFSSCLVMNGSIPRQILSSRRDWPEGFVVSGYTTSVDWAGSALLEFLYLNLILESGLPPARAAEAVLETLDYAGSSSGSCMDAAGFTWLTP
ncbi:hypothetical protein GX411_09330 [Candidatus Fermentibacteria bacterium]|nr:hypothetical protein [Candidatus Fermentibacteria bacterium]